MSPHHSWAWASWSNGCLAPQGAGGRCRFLTEAAHRSGLRVRLGGPWAVHPAAPAVGEGEVGHQTGALPPHPSASPHAAARIGPGALQCRASLPRRCGRPVGVGFSAVPQVASPASSPRRQQQSQPLGRCHTDRSGYWGPWTFAENTFSNEYFRLLVEERWSPKLSHNGKPWDGPDQFEDATGKLMMLPR